MTPTAQEQERRLIPRWRFSSQRVQSAELSGDPRYSRKNTLDKRYLDEKLVQWEQSPSVGNAIDLVSCGVGGLWHEEVLSAARYLDRHSDQLSRQAVSLVRVILPTIPERSTLLRNSENIDTLLFDHTRKQVSDARSRVRTDPRNVLAWLDLARAYTILGHDSQAKFSIRNALYLAPNHRHVLRSAVRLYIHVNEQERAHKLLLRCPRTPNDPWLVAAELAVSKVARRNPRFFRQGRKMVKLGGFRPEDVTELRSAIGTLEYYGGAHRKARMSIRASLMNPTDNALAQARWIASRLSSIPIAQEAFELPFGFEARYWQAFDEAKWSDAISECRGWLLDEPFSSRPALAGSYLGVSLTKNYQFAEACALAGLRAEPDNSMLRNNLVVALAYQGKINEAIAQFQKIRFPLSDDLPAYTYIATGGLIQFRLGQIDRGRKCYEIAEGKAPRSEQGQVLVYRAREELIANTTDASRYIERALSTNTNQSDPCLHRLQELLKGQSGESAEPTTFNPALSERMSPRFKFGSVCDDELSMDFLTRVLHG